MPGLALVLWGLFFLIAVAGRAALSRRRTGSWGVSGISGAPGSVEWVGGVLFVASFVLMVGSAVLQLDGAVDPLAALDGDRASAAGVALFVAGLGALVGAQLAMGASWRIGVEAEDRTELVTNGPFALVRNPIYSAMVPAVAGLVLLSPSVIGIAGLVALVVSLEIQTRLVEEPHLLRAHSEDYARYAARVGRFVPGLGKLDG